MTCAKTGFSGVGRGSQTLYGGPPNVMARDIVHRCSASSFISGRSLPIGPGFCRCCASRSGQGRRCGWRGLRRWSCPRPVALEPGGGRCRAGVPAGRGQLATQRQDPVPGLVGGLVRVRARPAGARLERIEAAGLVAEHELVHSPPGDAEAAGRLGLAQALADDGEDDHTRLRHASSSM